jgi:hypothetical protein
MPDLIRNRVTEKDIRDWLQQNGYQNSSTVLDSVELFAIKRPGWLQLFSFSGKVRRQSPVGEKQPKVDVWGIALDDERKPAGQQMEVYLFESEDEQANQLATMSEGMLTSNKSDDRTFGLWSILLMAVFFAAALFAIAMLKNLYE